MPILGARNTITPTNIDARVENLNYSFSCRFDAGELGDGNLGGDNGCQAHCHYTTLGR